MANSMPRCLAFLLYDLYLPLSEFSRILSQSLQLEESPFFLLEFFLKLQTGKYFLQEEHNAVSISKFTPFCRVTMPPGGACRSDNNASGNNVRHVAHGGNHVTELIDFDPVITTRIVGLVDLQRERLRLFVKDNNKVKPPSGLNVRNLECPLFFHAALPPFFHSFSLRAFSRTI